MPEGIAAKTRFPAEISTFQGLKERLTTKISPHFSRTGKVRYKTESRVSTVLRGRRASSEGSAEREQGRVESRRTATAGRSDRKTANGYLLCLVP